MVEVIVRVRPLSLLESANPQIKHVVSCLNGSIIVDAGRDAGRQGFMMGKHAPTRARQFHADDVLHPDCTQIELYNRRCRDVIMSSFQGINGAILAYGATGSGKTHSMFGGEMSAAGIVYQSMQEIFEEKQRLEGLEGKFVQVACTFLEVYNEDVFDLLSPIGKEKLQVLDLGQGAAEDAAGNKAGRSNPESLLVKKLTRVEISSIDDFSVAIENGHRNRSTAATHANAVSSRSHAIITIEIEVRPSRGATTGTFARVRLCDLAGSERAASTSNSGKRLQEGGNINKSLLALGSVVQALAKSKGSSQDVFIPYRGSKLTRLLKDCLGGNCRTLMLFCVSPSSTACEETMNTMMFAMQAREIQVAAQRNEFAVNVEEVAKEKELLVEKLRHELALAKEELQRLKDANGSVDASSAQTGGGCSPHSPVVPAAPPQPRISSERSPLQQSLDAIVRKKEALRRSQKDAEETCTDIDIRIREHSAKIANYVGSSTLFGNGEGALQAPPVGIAGSYQELSRLRSLFDQKKVKAVELQVEHDEIDLAATKIINEIRRERQNPLLELQLENARLQKTIVEAECLAAFYHQQYTALATKESNEWRPAVAQCVAVLRELALSADVPAELKLRAHLAIASTTVPFAATEEILDSHQKYVVSVVDGRPLTTSRIHRAMDITFANNPFTTSEQDKGQKDVKMHTNSGFKQRPPLGPGGGSPPPNGAMGSFGRSLSSSPLTSPAALQLQIKKLTLHVNPASAMMSPPNGSASGAAAKARIAAMSFGVSPAGGSPTPAGGQRFKSPVNGFAQQSCDGATPIGKGQLVPPSAPPPQSLVRLNTAQAVLTSGKKAGPPPKLEKENALKM